MGEMYNPRDRAIDESLQLKDVAAGLIDEAKIMARQPRLEEFQSSQADSAMLASLEEKIVSEENVSPRTLLRSQLFEKVLVSNDKELFGKTVESVPASRFDDVVNNTDLILEMPGTDGTVARLAIDAVVTENEYSVINKFDKIRSGIVAGKMPIKYFKSVLEPAQKGEIKNIPRVVVGIASGNFQKFCDVLRRQDEDTITLRNEFLTIIKSQLESEFVYELGVSGYKIGTAQGGKNNPTLSKPDGVVASRIYAMASRLKSGEWSDRQFGLLMRLFKSKSDVVEKISFPEHRELLQNTGAVWEVISLLLKQSEQNSSEKKNEAALFEETTSTKRLTSHWDPDIFDYWPVFVW